MEVYAKDLMALMDRWAPKKLAEKWDNPGLQAGDPTGKVKKVLVSLDLTRANAEYAAAHGVDMIISHHPFLFKALKTIDVTTEKGYILALLLTHHISAFAAHTNLDTAAGGVNDALADVLGLTGRTGLVPIHEKKWYKIAVFVPESHADAVRRALGDAGAGAVGCYSHCTFSAAGTGRFLPEDGAEPFLGAVGKEEEAAEVRIETFVTEDRLKGAVAAMLAAHPYEEAVYDVFELCGKNDWDTMGRIGLLPHPMTGEEALSYIKEKLGLAVIKYAGNTEKEIRKIALLGGAGAEFMGMAKAAGADLYLTGDVKYHEAQDAAAMGLLLADGGHFGTERVIIPVIAARIRKEAEEKGWDIEVIEDPTARDIFSYK